MLHAVKKSRQINSFSEVHPPHPRDLYARYGERSTPNAIHTTTREEPAQPSPTSHIPMRQISTVQKILNDLPGPDEGVKKEH